MRDHSITIKGTGTAETAFAKATFKVKVTKVATLGPPARDAAKPVVESVLALIKSHSDVVNADQLRTTFDVAPYFVSRSEGYVHAGYRATWTCDFACRDVSKATTIHDGLTGIPDVAADTPIFVIEDDAANRKAFEAAVANAKATFEHQCRALGLDPNHYRVAAWGVNDDRVPRGKMLSVSEDDGPIQIAPGRALVEMTVSVVYERL